MRFMKKEKGLTVNAITGTHVVFFGLDLSETKRKGFRGFGFQRFDPVEDETVWLRGMKTFESVEPHPALGETFSSRIHPIQSFQWADYSAKPGRDYAYTVVALYGQPAGLKSQIEIKVNVRTEPEIGGTHSVYFNRGSVATQEYARRYQDKKPSVAGPGAYEWLSRGLLEALVAFLGQAKKGWSIHGAIYEFQWDAALEAVKAAKTRGADVNIIFDEIEAHDSKGKPTGPWQKNREAVNKFNLGKVCTGRSNGKLMHNKFFVLSKNSKPVSVWTGSTNLTENGIFGHSNLGHIVKDAAVAKAYLAYWNRLKIDPAIDATYRGANIASGSTPPVKWTDETVAVFSPRGTNLDALNWYASLAGEAKNALLMTFAFGMHPLFQSVYSKNDDILRMGLLETTTRSPKTAAQDAIDMKAIRRRPNVVVAIGNRIVTNSFDRWLKELAQVHDEKVHVHWIHTKYMLLDPLGENPVVVTGSANFSKASTDTNDENMLVIQGNKRIADIYFGEFLRLYNHYAFREAVKRAFDSKKVGKPSDWKPQFLEIKDSWMKDYFDATDTSSRYARRKYFAGPMSL